MACSLEITSVLGVGPPGGSPTVIHVSGTATECREVKVEADCNGPRFGGTAPVTGNTWTIELAVPPDSNCKCHDHILIRATCVHDEGCSDIYHKELPCEPGGKCPQVTVDVAVGDCNSNGTRDVTLTSSITPPTAATGVAQWSFGDSTVGTAFTFTGTTTNTVTHGYPPGGPYTASLNIILPAGCPATNVTVGPLAACDCPRVVDLTATVTGCAGSGSTATVQFAGTVPGSPAGCEYQWTFGDGNNDVPSPGPSTSHAYVSEGTYPVAVTISCGACIRTTTVSVIVPPCCPKVTSLSATVQGCVDDKGNTATVTFVATTDPSAASGSFEWVFGDGASTTTTVPTATHIYGSVGGYTAQVTFKPSQAGCPDTTAPANVSIPRCGGGVVTPPPPPDGEGAGCTGLRWAGVILSILALLAVYIWLCVPGAGSAFGWAAAAFAAAAAIVFALWWFLCPRKPCRAGLLIGWQIALGAGTGALYFAPCCPWLWAIGTGLVAAGVAGFFAWWSACRKSFCQVVAELAVVVTVVLLPVLGWLAAVPFLAVCLNPYVAAWVSLLSAAIAVALAKCAIK